MTITDKQQEILLSDLEGIFSYAKQADRILDHVFYKSIKMDMDACKSYADIDRLEEKLNKIMWDSSVIF